MFVAGCLFYEVVMERFGRAGGEGRQEWVEGEVPATVSASTGGVCKRDSVPP